MPTLTVASRLAKVESSQIMDRLPGMVAVYNVDSGTYLFVNKSVKNLLGYDPKDIESGGLEFVTSLVHPADRASIIKKNTAALKQANAVLPLVAEKESIVSFEYRMRHADGHWVWLHTQGSIYSRTPKGKVENVLNISIDITERKAMEDNLVTHSKHLEKRVAEHGERLELALEASKIGIWEWNIGTGALIWSSEMMRLYGLDPTEKITYEKFMASLHVDDRAMKQALLMSAAETGKPYQVEHRCVWPDGSLHWILGKGKSYMKNGKPYRMVGTAMNIDDRKSAAKLRTKTVMLKAQRKELLELNKSKDDFIALASHQLRTPATGVKQYVGMLLGNYAGKASPTQRSLLSKAYESNERQIKIVNDLLLVAKVDSGKITLNKQNCDIKQLINAVVKEHQIILKQHRQKVTVAVPEKMSVHADAFYLRTVLENLLSNASKYSGDGSPIAISADFQGKTVRIAVKDQGIGIRPQDQSKLYHKFTRIHNDEAKAVDGNGLGLYWSKKIVDLHDGNLSLVSRLGLGSTFAITLPVN